LSRVEQAVSCFKEGALCSQAVFATYAPQLGLDRETAVRIATGFGAGMARLGETCGAVTGAFLVIGLKHGNVANWLVEEKENKKKENTYRLVSELANRFQSRHGSIRCKELIGCDLGTPEGRKLADEQNVFRTLCPKFVRDAAEIIEELL